MTDDFMTFFALHLFTMDIVIVYGVASPLCFLVCVPLLSFYQQLVSY